MAIPSPFLPLLWIAAAIAAAHPARLQGGASRPSTGPATEPALAAALEKLRGGGDLESHGAIVRAGEMAISGLAAIANDPKANGNARMGAANLLGEIRSPKAVEPLLAMLKDPWFNLRRCAAMALGEIRDARAKGPLEELAAKDPFVWKDEKGESRYLVREDAKKALEVLSGERTAATAGLVKEAETFLADAAAIPTNRGPAPPARKLPWPFPGGFAKQNLYNNYQQATDDYVHGGLDLLQAVGTEVHAVADGTVAIIATNYPDWTTHHFFVVTEAAGGDAGWSYTHVDPKTYTFQVGDRVKAGQVLGKVVDFSVGGRDGVDHLHLNYVRFRKRAENLYDLDPLFDPLPWFEWEDRIPPRVSEPIRFVRAGTLTELPRRADGVSLVSGKVDVVAGIADAGLAEAASNWGPAVVTLEIRGERAKPWRKLVFDGRGPLPDPRAARALFLTFAEKQAFPEMAVPQPVFQGMKLTHTDGDGVLEAADALQCWDTAERTADGKGTRFPDGTYEVIVRAWDAKGNLGEGRASVRVENAAKK